MEAHSLSLAVSVSRDTVGIYGGASNRCNVHSTRCVSSGKQRSTSLALINVDIIFIGCYRRTYALVTSYSSPVDTHPLMECAAVKRDAR